MQRLASRILIVVGVFVLVVAGMLIARTRAARVESVESSSSKADLSIKEVQLEEDSGGVRWQLKADQALVFEAEGRTSLRRIDLKVHERDRSWNVLLRAGHRGDRIATLSMRVKSRTRYLSSAIEGWRNRAQAGMAGRQ